MPHPPKITSLDELERLQGPGSLTWLPVRKTLDVRAFGCNAYVAGASGEDVIEPHTEKEAGHQELYFVARGHATFTIDGARHDAPSGTYVFLPDPESHRHAIAEVAGTVVLSFGGPPSFEPSPWEAYMGAAALMQDPGTRDQARTILIEATDSFPDHPVVFYNLACLEALDGHPDEALQALTKAISGRDEAVGWARNDDDLASLRDDPRFTALLAGG